MIFIWLMIRSNKNQTMLGIDRKRHSGVHYETQFITLTAGFFSTAGCRSSHDSVQNENQTQTVALIFKHWQTESTASSSHVGPHTDLPFSDGTTERPTSDWTQHCLSVCEWSLKIESVWPEDLIVLCRQRVCVRAAVCFCLSSAQLSPAAGMSCTSFLYSL